MDAAYGDLDGRARKNSAAILRGLARVGQSTVSKALGVSESTVSRWKDEEIERIGRMLAACGLKAVSTEMRCYPPEEVNALFVLARGRLDGIASRGQLQFEDDPE